MVVLRVIIGVATPPSVSIESESGVTSRRRMSLTSPVSTPACTAAPIATTSSGLTERLGSLPKKSLTICWIFGVRVEPPTRTTSSISFAVFCESARDFLVGSIARWKRSSHIASNLARDSFFTRCLGPEASAVRKGRLISVSSVLESSILAFSAASLRRWRTNLSFETSRPDSALNSVISHSITRWSRSSPPRCVSPLVAFTTTTPSPTSSTEMSNVPPPQS